MVPILPARDVGRQGSAAVGMYDRRMSAAPRRDDLLIYIGTIGKIDAGFTRMRIDWLVDTDVRSAEVAIGAATSITRDGVGVSRRELQVGVRAAVIAMVNIYIRLDVPEATDILLGRYDLDSLLAG